MNKFYKSIKLTAFVLALVSLAGCKKDVDVIGISDDLANKTMLGYYTYTSLDSVNMQTSKKEFYLNRDKAGNQTGYFRENAAGDGVSSDQTTTLTWTSVMAEDKLSMTITATLKDGSVKTFKWADGIIYAAGNPYEKSVANISNIDVQQDVYKQVDNVVFECSEASYYDHKVNKDYLAWSMKIAQNKTEEEANALLADTLNTKANYQDTIIWFLRNMTNNQQIANVTRLDTIISGTDTTFNVVGYGKKVLNAKGKYNVQYLASSVKTMQVQVNDWPQSIVYSSITLKNVNNARTAEYKWQKSYAGREHYMPEYKGIHKNDTTLDSLYIFTASKWVIPSFTNQAKFDILFLGNGDSTVTRTDKGVETVLVDKKETNAHLKLEMFGYTEKKKDGKLLYIEVQQGDIKYRKK